MKKHTLFVVAACWTLGFASIHAQQPLYKQADAPIEDRVKDLVGRMTLEEKVGQICCPLGWEVPIGLYCVQILGHRRRWRPD